MKEGSRFTDRGLQLLAEAGVGPLLVEHVVVNRSWRCRGSHVSSCIARLTHSTTRFALAR
jgi:hypothetical protein